MSIQLLRLSGDQCCPGGQNRISAISVRRYADGMLDVAIGPRHECLVQKTGPDDTMAAILPTWNARCQATWSRVLVCG